MDNNPDDWKRAAAVMAQENAASYYRSASAHHHPSVLFEDYYHTPNGDGYMPREWVVQRQTRSARMSAHARSMMGIES